MITCKGVNLCTGVQAVTLFVQTSSDSQQCSRPLHGAILEKVV